MTNLFTKRGEEAQESANKQKIDLKKAYIRLKEDESVRVRLLGQFDYVEYLAVGDFNLGIYTQPSLRPLGERDAFDEVQEIVRPLPDDHELADFKRLYAKQRYIFAFADIDSGELRFFDASKGQAKKLIKQIEEYKEDLGEIAFNFKRTGQKTETSYALNPILRLKGDDQAKFDKFEGEVVADEVFNSVLVPRTYEQQLESLEKAGFPVKEYFNSMEDDVTDIDETKLESDEDPMNDIA
ncbi:hypothetical protein COM97_26445 [Bacillus thuringiensis]|uniref:hypothetical protein n=1 Tax=Bacillus thuringiensis TaxID=1428 RepID=UPI000BEBAE5D|nr:hypothetical protein [Bacillus thuringiensis]PEF03551.1 hypothetical protein COM97_26445 [Bacillus thuringiensis]